MFGVSMSYKIHGLQISPPIDYVVFSYYWWFPLLCKSFLVCCIWKLIFWWRFYGTFTINDQYFLWASIFLLASWGRVINLEEKPGSSWINSTTGGKIIELEPRYKPGPDVKLVKLVILSCTQLQHLGNNKYRTKNCQSSF